METSKNKFFDSHQKSWISETSIKITLIIVAAVLLLAIIGIGVYFYSNPGQTINAQGISQIKAVPDLVSVYFNVETSGADAKEAKDKNAEIVDAVITALVKEGFERKEITTENYNIYPEYDWINNRQELKGYKAIHNIKVEFSTSKTDKIGEAIDAGVDAGASISYINFELSIKKQNEYKALALKQATEDARIKAEAIASGAGKSIGRIVSISSSSFDYYPWPIYRADGIGSVMEAKAAATNIQPGEQEINAQVNVVYTLR